MKHISIAKMIIIIILIIFIIGIKPANYSHAIDNVFSGAENFLNERK